MQDFQDECFEEGFFKELDKLVEEHLHTKVIPAELPTSLRI
jgi:hypothetical protein